MHWWVPQAVRRQASRVRLLPAARASSTHLTEQGVPWAIATSGRREAAQPALDMLSVGSDVVVVTRDQVPHAKPDPDLFLAAAERLLVDITHSIVVGDSVWDLLGAHRAQAS